jgi:hypothetical protein
MFKIYVPEELRFFYADELGNSYDAPSDDVVEAPYSEAEALRWVRQLRNDRLYDCDWTQLPDAPLTDAERAQWRQYRQALRDMMDNFEWGVTTWPTL